MAVAAAMAKKTPSGEETKREVKILNVLKDEKINTLAIKYLGSDFSVARERYMSYVRDCFANEARYRKALADADAEHSDMVKLAKGWEDVTQAEREKEVSRLKSEIWGLEQRRNKIRKESENLTKNKMLGSPRQERERAEKGSVLREKMNDIQSEIVKKRSQLDSLTYPDRAVCVAQREASRSLSIRSNASIEHRRRLDDIERTMKPKRSLQDIVSDCEAETVGRLHETLAAKIAQSDKEMSDLRDKRDKISEMEVSLPLATIQDLNNFRKMLLAF